jgi:hypothetical protein
LGIPKITPGSGSQNGVPRLILFRSLANPA